MMYERAAYDHSDREWRCGSVRSRTRVLAGVRRPAAGHQFVMSAEIERSRSARGGD